VDKINVPCIHTGKLVRTFKIVMKKSWPRIIPWEMSIGDNTKLGRGRKKINVDMACNIKKENEKNSF